MNFSSSFNSQSELVVDTSVLINLSACKSGEHVLAALPHTILVPREVANELSREKSTKYGEHNFLTRMSEAKNVVITELSKQEFSHFIELTSGLFSLGDGESATIAVAISRQATPIIDEKKGRARFHELLPSTVAGWSIDLLTHEKVMADLGDEQITELLYWALRDGRMRIPVEAVEFMISRIGVERAKDCTSLPNYRELFCNPVV